MGIIFVVISTQIGRQIALIAAIFAPIQTQQKYEPRRILDANKVQVFQARIQTFLSTEFNGPNQQTANVENLKSFAGLKVRQVAPRCVELRQTWPSHLIYVPRNFNLIFFFSHWNQINAKSCKLCILARVVFPFLSYPGQQPARWTPTDSLETDNLPDVAGHFKARDEQDKQKRRPLVGRGGKSCAPICILGK